MGFMDKLKEAAQDVATEAKKATAQGKTKLDQMQTRKKADDAAKRLGYLIRAQRARGVAAGAEVDRLVAEITQLEDEIAEAEAAQPPAARSRRPTRRRSHPPPRLQRGRPPQTPPRGISSTSYRWNAGLIRSFRERNPLVCGPELTWAGVRTTPATEEDDVLRGTCCALEPAPVAPFAPQRPRRSAVA